MTRSVKYTIRILRAIFVAILLSSSPTLAHEIAPAVIDMSLVGGDVTIEVKVNLEGLIMEGASDQHIEVDIEKSYLHLRTFEPNDLFREAQTTFRGIEGSLGLDLDGIHVPLVLTHYKIPAIGDTAVARTSILTFSGTLPAQTGQLVWRAPPALGASVLRTFVSGSAEYPEPTRADYVEKGSTVVINLSEFVPQSLGAVVRNYIAVGFDHIIPKGLDHILFVIGLFLLSARLRPLLTQITMFTLAHTITLALGALGWATVPGYIVEPLIAASIIFVAVENLFTDRLTYWRPVLVFGFGLLHGLGFASVLGQFGLPSTHFLPALIAFNVGVEIGQLTIIAVCFLTVGLWFSNKSWYHKSIVSPASAVIAVTAMYWFVERTGFLA